MNSFVLSSYFLMYYFNSFIDFKLYFIRVYFRLKQI